MTRNEDASIFSEGSEESSGSINDQSFSDGLEDQKYYSQDGESESENLEYEEYDLEDETFSPEAADNQEANVTEGGVSTPQYYQRPQNSLSSTRSYRVIPRNARHKPAGPTPRTEADLAALHYPPYDDPSHQILKRNSPYSSKPTRPSGRELPHQSKQATVEDFDELDTQTLPPSRTRQLQTRLVLKGLKSPPGSEGWSTEHEQVLRQNLESLLEATELSASSEEFPGEHSPPAGRKRMRSHSHTKSKPKPPSKTAKRQKTPDLEDKLDNDIDLIDANPQPVQMEFNPHPLTDRNDTWFENEFRILFLNLNSFAETYFRMDLDEFDCPDLWSGEYSPAFLNYVSQVAEPDPNGALPSSHGAGAWDTLVWYPKMRKWVVIGVLMAILEKEIFDADLWGAKKEEKELLFGIEKALFTNEGFTRAALRAHTVRAILSTSGSPLTSEFHPSVTSLTAQVALLFEPFLTILNSEAHFPPLDVRAMHQSLHNLISHAAYLSIAMRLSPTIFYFSSLTPGTDYQPEDHLSLENKNFEESKNAVVAQYETKHEAWTKRKKELQDEIRDLIRIGKEGGKKYKALKEELKELESQKPHHYSYNHRARAQISAWPNIRRFKPGSKTQEKKGVLREEMRGFRIYEIGKGAAVMYFGTDRWSRPAGAAGGHVDLGDWVNAKHELYGIAEKDGGAVDFVFGAVIPPSVAFVTTYGAVIRRETMQFVGNMRTGLEFGLGTFVGGLGERLLDGLRAGLQGVLENGRGGMVV